VIELVHSKKAANNFAADTNKVVFYEDGLDSLQL